MATNEFKRCLYRIMSDLVKSDNVISIAELNEIEKICKSFKLTNGDKTDSFSMTLAAAAEHMSKQTPKLKERLIKCMTNCAQNDGECSRDEAMMINAIEIVCQGKGQIISLPLANRPLSYSQILYVDPTYNPKQNDLDKKFDEIKTIVELAGFELIYIPKVAETFKQYGQTDSLKRLLLMINPTLSKNVLSDKVRSLQEMDSRSFYIQVLNEKLQMNLGIDKPIWMIRLPNNIVNGVGYTNYLCYNVEKSRMSRQLRDFVSKLNQRLRTYSIIVNPQTNISSNFSYNGFHRALLDVMASERIDSWEIKVYIRAGAAAVVDRSKKGEKYSILLTKGDRSYEVRINGREAAFYLLLLCASAGQNREINFEYDKKRSKIIQRQYEAAYRVLSNRDSHTPDICLSSTFRPIKAKVMKELGECGIKGDLHLFKPTKNNKNSYYIPLPHENVKIVSSEGETYLKDSTIFKTFLELGDKTPLD